MEAHMKDQLEWRHLETMLLIRRFEEALIQLYSQKTFSGHFHVCIGQEATAAVAMDVLEKGDHITTTHRNHGHMIARGVDVKSALAEILGRRDGMNSGYAGTFHLTAPRLGFLSTSGIVGGAISLGIGGGYACKQRGDASVTMALFGDGALEEGIAFESLTLASLWKLPVVFLCENNDAELWTGSGQGSREHAVRDLCDLPRLCGITTMSVPGIETAPLDGVLRKAVDQCRRGEGPVFVEVKTPRWPGNRTQFPTQATGLTDVETAIDGARIHGEHAQWVRSDDPIIVLASALAAQGGESAARLRELDHSVTSRMDEAVAFAKNSPWPDAGRALDHAFA
jgi:acetoin:2,6-dichlorophenolindophenol oxidoreductase subunit alpha